MKIKELSTTFIKTILFFCIFTISVGNLYSFENANKLKSGAELFELVMKLGVNNALDRRSKSELRKRAAIIEKLLLQNPGNGVLVMTEIYIETKSGVRQVSGTYVLGAGITSKEALKEYIRGAGTIKKGFSTRADENWIIDKSSSQYHWYSINDGKIVRGTIPLTREFENNAVKEYKSELKHKQSLPIVKQPTIQTRLDRLEDESVHLDKLSVEVRNQSNTFSGQGVQTDSIQLNIERHIRDSYNEGVITDKKEKQRSAKQWRKSMRRYGGGGYSPNFGGGGFTNDFGDSEDKNYSGGNGEKIEFDDFIIKSDPDGGGGSWEDTDGGESGTFDDE